jgi:predicted transposase YbfD/YdcC
LGAANRFPKMLEWLDGKGHMITIDAMGCQHAIASQILKKEGVYIFSLKGNQGTLSSDVQLYFEDLHLIKPKSFVEYDKSHGRIETRECWVSRDVQ